MAFDAPPPAKPAFDMEGYMARFCGRQDLVSNQPEGISGLSKEAQLAHCLRETEASVAHLFPSRSRPCGAAPTEQAGPQSQHFDGRRG